MFQNIAISASLLMTGAVTVDGTLNLENKYYYYYYENKHFLFIKTINTIIIQK